jgi:hypothetical protein
VSSVSQPKMGRIVFYDQSFHRGSIFIFSVFLTFSYANLADGTSSLVFLYVFHSSRIVSLSLMT